MGRFRRRAPVRSFAVLLLLQVIVLAGHPSVSFGLASHFFSADSTAIGIAAGSSYTMDVPAWLDGSSNQNKDTFAYKVFSALFMLGYQTEISYNWSNSWMTPHLLTLNAFQTQNGFAASDLLDGPCLVEIDRQLVLREAYFAAIAPSFQLYSHMQPLHANDVSKDTWRSSIISQ